MMFKNVLKPLLITMVTFVVIAPHTFAGEGKEGCAHKVEGIQKEIDYAVLYKNKEKEVGLRKALDEVNMYCTDADLRADFDKKIADKKKKIVDRQDELRKAQMKGDLKKIAKKQNKVREAELELIEMRQEKEQFFK